MDQQQAYDIVAEYLAEQFEIEASKIHPKAKLFKDLGLDSIDALDMIVLLESDYNMSVDEDELKKLRTVQDIVDYILTHVPADVKIAQ